MTPPAAKSARVLVVDDDPTVSEIVSRYLERAGFAVERCADGTAALARILAAPPDLVVLDVMLPGLDGLEICRRVRATSSLPIIMLTAKGAADERIAGLELGADDYLPKPFSPRELVVRVQAVLRRAGVRPAIPPWDGPVVAAGISVDERARAVTVAGHAVSLTVREFDLLAFLMHHPREVFRREALLEQVWGYTFGDTSTVTVHVRRLREKVEQDPGAPRHILTVWGVGYRFEPDPAP